MLGVANQSSAFSLIYFLVSDSSILVIIIFDWNTLFYLGLKNLGFYTIRYKQLMLKILIIGLCVVHVGRHGRIYVQVIISYVIHAIIHNQVEMVQLIQLFTNVVILYVKELLYNLLSVLIILIHIDLMNTL